MRFATLFWKDGEEISSLDEIGTGDIALRQGDKTIKAARLPNGLISFKPDTGADRVVLDCVTALQNGADLLWIETEKPHVGQIASMVDRIKAIVPDAKLIYNNSPSFNWTLNFRQQVFDAWTEEGKDVSAYSRDNLMSRCWCFPSLDHAANLPHSGTVNGHPIQRLLW